MTLIRWLNVTSNSWYVGRSSELLCGLIAAAGAHRRRQADSTADRAAWEMGQHAEKDEEEGWAECRANRDGTLSVRCAASQMTNSETLLEKFDKLANKKKNQAA